MKRLSPSLLTIVCLLLIAFAVPVEAKDKWTKVKSKNFTLIGNGGEKDIRQVATRLEQFREVFTKLFPTVKFVTPVPTTVVVFKDMNSFNPFRPGNVAGYFQSGEDINYIALTTETYGDQTPYSIIFHEYTHLLVNNSIGDDVPLWFNEGLAEYYSTFSISDDRKVILGNLIGSHLHSLRETKMLPLRTLFTVDHKSAYYNEKNKQNIFYAQSWLLMHYLIQNEEGKRLNQLNVFFANLDKGMDVEKAFTSAFQITIEQMEKELQQYLKKSTFRATAITFENKLVFDSGMETSQLSEAESQAYLGDMLAHMHLVNAEKYLQKAISLDPNQAMAHASLGMFYAKQGRFADAKKSLEKAIASNSQNYLAHYYYAEAISFEQTKESVTEQKFTPEELKALRSSLKKAIELAPTFPDSYRLLAFVNLVAEEQIDESIDLLKRAITYSPGRQELYFMLGQCYLAKEDYKTAKELLEPIARSSSKDEIKTHAESLLNFIKEVEEQKAKYEAFKKEQEEKKKKYEETKQNQSTVGTDIQTTTDTSTNQRPKLTRKKNETDETQDFQEGFYTPREGESQARGQLVRIDCVGGQSVVVVVKVGEKLYKFYKSDLANVRFVTFTAEVPLGGQIGCGAVKNPPEIVATFRALSDKKLKYDGEIVIIEFVPKDNPQNPE